MKVLIEHPDLRFRENLSVLYLQEKPISIPIWKNTIVVNSVDYLKNEFWEKSEEIFYPIIEFKDPSNDNRKRTSQRTIEKCFYDDTLKMLRFSHINKILLSSSYYILDINPFGTFRREYFDQLLSKLVRQTINEDSLKIIWYIMNYELT